MISLHETCEQYVARRLSEGWRIISQIGFNVILQSPDGIIRPVDLRNDVETLRPNAAGAETSLDTQYPNSTYHWDKVDEETPDDDSTFVSNYNLTTYERDLYNLPAHSVGSGAINFIKVYFRCRQNISGYTNYAKPSLKSDSTVTDGTEVSISSTTWGTYSQQWDTNPADGQVWSWVDIDALQIGVSLRAPNNGSPLCTQVYVEVDYTPPFTPFRSYYPHILAH